jgi:hypothetical protein
MFSMAVVVIAGSIGHPSTTRAAPLTFEFSGRVSVVTDGGRQLDNSVATGTSFHGSYTFDDAAVDSDPWSMGGTYASPAPLGRIAVTMGSYTFESDPVSGMLRVIVRDGWDLYQVSSSFDNLSSDSSLTVVSIGWTLNDLIIGDPIHTNDAISNDRQLLVPPDLGVWTPGDVDFHVGLEGPETSFSIYGRVSSVAEVPEPSPSLLVAAGLLALAVRRRSRRLRPVSIELPPADAWRLRRRLF